MGWKKLLAEHKIHTHATSKKEIEALRALIRRDLADAQIPGLSDDRRYATAYNAALQTAKMAVCYAGYRLASTLGHHRLTFDAARLALGPAASEALDFFEAARRKRNFIDYDYASVATSAEADEIVEEAEKFWHSWSSASRRTIRSWYDQVPPTRSNHCKRRKKNGELR